MTTKRLFWLARSGPSTNITHCHTNLFIGHLCLSRQPAAGQRTDSASATAVWQGSILRCFGDSWDTINSVFRQVYMFIVTVTHTLLLLHGRGYEGLSSVITRLVFPTIKWCFEGIYRVHNQGRRISEQTNKHQDGIKHSLAYSSTATWKWCSS